MPAMEKNHFILALLVSLLIVVIQCVRYLLKVRYKLITISLPTILIPSVDSKLKLFLDKSQH